MSQPMTIEELEILAHATGWDSKRKKDRLYRNHYVSEETPVLKGLCERGLLRQSRPPSPLSGGDPVFSVTDEGIALLKRWRP